MPGQLLILNPVSGNAKGAHFWLRTLRDQGVDAQLFDADNDETLPDLTDTKTLIVAGGDGTVRLHAAACVAADCTLGVLPSGTGNDFARGLSIPLEPEDACQNISKGQTHTIDVGRLNDQVFLNVAHIGFATEVTRGVNHTSKDWWGRFAYFRTVIDRLHDLRGFKATIRDDHREYTGRWLQITIANGRSFGGGQQFFDATPFDGQLDLLAIRPRPLPQLIFVWLLARLRRAAPETPVVMRLRADSFEIAAESQMPVTADGEALARLPARFSVMPGALRVIAPEQSASTGS